VASIYHTGGSTGAPKLVQHTHGNQCHCIWLIRRYFDFSPDDVVINGHPLFHVAGALNFGTTTVGSTNHLAANLLKSMSGLDFVIVPFRTPGDLLTAVLRNDVDAIIQSYGALKSAVESNQIRALGITTPKRTAYAPDVPTVDEAGVTGFDVVTWNGAFAPTGTPPEVIGTLNREMRGALSDPELVQRYTELGLEPLPTTPDELSGRLRAEIGKWGRVIREAGIEQQ